MVLIYCSCCNTRITKCQEHAHQVLLALPTTAVQEQSDYITNSQQWIQELLNNINSDSDDDPNVSNDGLSISASDNGIAEGTRMNIDNLVTMDVDAVTSATHQTMDTSVDEDQVIMEQLTNFSQSEPSTGDVDSCSDTSEQNSDSDATHSDGLDEYDNIGWLEWDRFKASYDGDTLGESFECEAAATEAKLADYN
ncbi:hypothetical protein BDQ17DRAFT_1327900 [Cyathus striatus]|nr:hypothetical protein BDQ17DRAFT_1327900 [Cyathus striatus]